MSTITLEHTHAGGTLARGTARGDGSAEVLKSCGWRWGRSIGAWFIPSSRDHLPNDWKIDRTRKALEAAGFTVELDVSRELRDMAEVEAGKIERQADRVEALEAKAERKAGAADAADDRARRALDSLPYGGEPIKIGHHSERRHRNAIAKADRAMGASVAADREATKAAERAEIAARTTDHRYDPQTVARRIERLAPEMRKLERSVKTSNDNAERYAAAHADDPERIERYNAHTARLVAMLEEKRQQIAFWEGVRAEQIADGVAGDFSPETIAKGDVVGFRFDDAAIVTRVNPKGVSVVYWPRWDSGRMNGQTVPYGDIKTHRKPDDDERAALLARAKAGTDENKKRTAALVAQGYAR
ncbi:DUF3560 domain-containing protein [Agromyces sp. NPDC058104]|uniref:DUF3560 domain-containing protein n=1 Tax=Agromyces sp. NPDC058104 TaxID=3346342 RepID=UPI0036DAE0EC